MAEQKDALIDMLKEAHDQGRLQYPADIADKPEESKKYIQRLAEETLNTAPGSKSGRESIPIALGIATGAAVASWSPMIPVALMNTLKLVLFNPVEVLALNTSVGLQTLQGNRAFHSNLTEICKQTRAQTIAPLPAQSSTLAWFGGKVIDGASTAARGFGHAAQAVQHGASGAASALRRRLPGNRAVGITPSTQPLLSDQV
jgi:hypothetical protein